MGIGHGTGEQRAEEAAKAAISSPLLESSIDGAKGVLLSIAGPTDLTLHEVNTAADTITRVAHPDANIIFGANVDDTLSDQVWVTVIATRFDGRGRRADGSAQGELRAAGTTTAAVRRPAERRAGTAPNFESRPRDLSIDVPEFVPGR
jgi:cell division protein FtsZ